MLCDLIDFGSLFTLNLTLVTQSIKPQVLVKKSSDKMVLAFNFLIIILIELPIIALFFKRKKRQAALGMALLINIISWSVTHIVFFTFDINMYYVAVVLAIGEAIAFHFLLPCNWKKAFIISLIVNSLSFSITHAIPEDLFQQKPYNIKTTIQN